MVFYGVLAALFFTIVLGALWPARDRAGIPEIILGLIGKSLFLSWLVVVVSYWLNLPNLFIPLVVSVALGLAWQWRSSKREVLVARPALQVILGVGVVLLCVHLFLGGFGSDYRLIFMTWDAVVSWNRWAIELSGNQYVPMAGAAYPLLFPGLWSLIYKAQGDTSVWIIVKLTLFVVPVILCLLIALLISRRLYVSAALLAAFIGQFFFVSNAFSMLNGNMDIPISTMMLAAGVLMYVATERLSADDTSAAYGLTLLAAIFVGLASITKQQGIVMAAPLTLLIGVGVMRGQFSVRAGVLAFGVAAVPLLTFLSIYLSIQSNPFGVLPLLASISKKASPHADTTVTALNYVLDMVPKAALGLIVLLACANFFNPRRLGGQLGITFLALGVAAFFFYAKCCSYEARNGWWVLILLVISALFGLGSVEREQSRSFSAAILSASMLVASITSAALVTGSFFKDETARASQEEMQWTIAGYQMSLLIRNNLHLFGPGDRLLSEIDPAGWLPTVRERFSLCGGTDTRCIEKALASARRTFVLIRPGVLEYPELRPHLTPDKLIGDADGMQLYGPIETAASTETARERSVIEEAQRGTPLRLILDRRACERQNLGSLECGVPYEARYNSATNMWTITGPDRHSGKEVTNSYDNAPARPGNISIWGMAAIFDRWGTLIFGGAKAGTLAPLTEPGTNIRQ